MILASNVTGGIRRWGDLGNFVEGDCTVAAYYHVVMAKNRQRSRRGWLYRLGFSVPGTPYALEEYAAYLATIGESPSPSTGVGEEGWLDWQKSNGLVVEWAQVKPVLSSDPRDFETRIREAMVDYGGAMMAGYLTQRAVAASGPRVVWTTGPDAIDTPNPSFSHSVALLATTAERDYCVTWGKWQPMTLDFRAACFPGVFVFLHCSETDLPGFGTRLANLRALKAAQ